MIACKHSKAAAAAAAAASAAAAGIASVTRWHHSNVLQLWKIQCFQHKDMRLILSLYMVLLHLREHIMHQAEHYYLNLKWIKLPAWQEEDKRRAAENMRGIISNWKLKSQIIKKKKK